MDYDLVVIGSGPAGEKGAAAAAWHGKRVALIERAELGGTCAHHGTLPSKSLRESAVHLSGMRQRGIGGLLKSAAAPLSVASLLAHKETVCAVEAERVANNLRRHGIDVLRGQAELVDGHTVRLRSAEGERLITAEYVLLATGSRPFRPPDLAFDLEEIYDSDEILRLDFVPRSMLVYGAGVIGSEYAAMFAALGVKVTLCEPRDALLPFVDPEIRDALQQAFVHAGIELRFGSKLTSAKVLRPNEVEVVFDDGERRVVDKFLYAAGRVGNSNGLGLEALGVQTDSRGLVKVDPTYRTACPSVFAVGDVIGFPALASTSMEQGRIAVRQMFGVGLRDGLNSSFPYGIYTIPELSMVGETEASARARGEDVEVGRAWMSENARGQINGSAEGMLKLVFRASDHTLLGVHVIGEQAAEVVHIGMMVMQAGGRIDAFIDAVFNYPTLSEAYKYAAYDGLGRLERRSARPAPAQ
jgi:NAD(P) transhydrogenase